MNTIDSSNWKMNSDLYQNIEKKKRLKKRRRKIWVAGILAILLVCMGTGAAYAYPYIQEVVLPKKQLAKVIENECGALSENVDVKLKQLTQINTDQGKRYKGTVTLGQQIVNGTDRIDDIGAETIYFDFEVQSQTQTLSGNIQMFSQTENKIKYTIDFKGDASHITVKVPELTSDTIEIKYADTDYEKELGYAWEGLISIFGSPKAERVTEYESSIQAAVKDIISGFRVILEKSTIERTENIKVPSLAGEQKIDVFEITITPQAVQKGLETMIENIYADRDLNSYLTLIATYTKMSKNEILEHCENLTAKMENIPIILCVSKENRILSLDMKVKQPQLGVDIEFNAGCIEDQKITDYHTYELIINQVELFTDKWNQYIPEAVFQNCSGKLRFQISNSILTLHQLELNGNLNLDIPAEYMDNGKKYKKQADVNLNYSGHCELIN